MAIKTISNAGGNFNTTGAWTDGILPIAGDSVIATATSGPLTISAATVSIVSANFTNYTSTLTIDNVFNITTTVVFVAGMTIAGTTGTLTITPTTGASLTSGGKTLTCNLTTAGTSQTYTLVDNWTVDGTVTLQGTTTQIINGNSLFCNSNLIVNGVAQSGSTTIILSGTGSWSSAFTGRVLQNNLTINTSGTITFDSAQVLNYNTGTLTYIAGDVITTDSTLTIAASTTLNLGLMPTALNNLTISATSTITLSSTLSVNGTFTISASCTWNGSILYIGGNLTLTTPTSATTSGTTLFILNGTGTWSANTTTSVIRNNLTINTNGIITFGAIVVFSTQTLTYISGKVIIPRNSVFHITLVVTTTLINCHKINFNVIQITAGGFVVMNEFFSGSPNKPIRIQAATAANYNITFQNGYEKIAKFVKVSNLTLTNTAISRGSLLILNNKGKYFRGSNNIGNIRYTNTTPNGIAKGDPTVPNQMTTSIGGYLSDPVFN